MSEYSKKINCRNKLLIIEDLSCENLYSYFSTVTSQQSIHRDIIVIPIWNIRKMMYNSPEVPLETHYWFK